ncbi:MAG: hypothetical protein EB059_11430, partial [Alphaproteobacteria bacterium]|nr:hypothetical protein [Alphaproteobacteria bacterium]
RPSNVDTPACMEEIYTFMRDTQRPIFFPIHLRTHKRLVDSGMLEQFTALKQHVLTGPMGYLDTVAALTHCQMVITDSGGLQKEAFYARKPAIVLLDEAPWPDLLASGWQRVIGSGKPQMSVAINGAMQNFTIPQEIPACYGEGNAGELIVQHLIDQQFVV